jgi:hypothetical protein
MSQEPVTVTIDTLRQHWLRVMECDHTTGQDKPHCACSLVDLGWHPNVGAAVEAWLAHVAAVRDCSALGGRCEWPQTCEERGSCAYGSSGNAGVNSPDGAQHGN